MWDWQYFVDYSIIQVEYGGYFRLSVPQYIVMDMNNVMWHVYMTILQYVEGKVGTFVSNN